MRPAASRGNQVVQQVDASIGATTPAGGSAPRSSRRKPGRQAPKGNPEGVAPAKLPPSRACSAAWACAGPRAHLRLESRVTLRKRRAHALGPLPGSIARACRSGCSGDSTRAARHARRGRGRRAAGPGSRCSHLESGGGASRERMGNACSLKRPVSSPMRRTGVSMPLVLFDWQSIDDRQAVHPSSERPFGKLGPKASTGSAWRSSPRARPGRRTARSMLRSHSQLPGGLTKGPVHGFRRWSGPPRPCGSSPPRRT